MQIHFSPEPPSLEAYNRLRSLVGWARLPEQAGLEAFDRTLMFCCCFAGAELIGFGRVVGDGAAYLYLQDVMVAPNHQRAGIGSAIVRTLISSLEPELRSHAYLGLLAVSGTEEFYARLNFEPITPDRNTAMQWKHTSVNQVG